MRRRAAGGRAFSARAAGPRGRGSRPSARRAGGRESPRRPFARDEPPQEAEVAVERLELPASLLGQLARPVLERTVGLDAHPDERDPPVVAGHRLEYVAGVVLAVLRGESGEVEPQRPGLAREAVRAVDAALEPAGRLEVGPGPLLEIAGVAVAAAEERRDAVVSAQQDERHAAGLEAGEAVVAQAVGESHGVVPPGVGRVDGRLQALAHRAAAEVVKALGQELDVHPVRRRGGEVAHLAEEDLAGHDPQAHRRKPSRPWPVGPGCAFARDVPG